MVFETKRWSMLFLVLLMVFITACSGNTNGSPESKKTEETAETAETAEPKAEEVKDPFGPLPELVTVNLVKKIRVGDNENPEGETLTDNLYVKQIEEKLNVKINWLWSQKDSPYQDKIKLAIASNDLPDIFTVDYATYLDLVENGMLEDLTQVYDELASDYLREIFATDGGKAMENLKIDGKTYGISALSAIDNASQLAWVRKDWLDKLDLKPPSNVEELKTVVEAFNKNYKTTGIPGKEDSGGAKNSFGYEGLMLALDARPFLWIKDGSGKISYGSVQPEMKQALSEMRDMYAKGLLDREFATTKGDQWAQKIASGKAGVFFNAWWGGWYPIGDSIKNDPTADWRAYAIKDTKGQYFGKQEPPVGEINVVRKGFKHPELIVKIWNYQAQGGVDESFNPYAGKEKGASWNAWTLDLPLWTADLGVIYYKNIKLLLDGTPADQLKGMNKDQLGSVVKLTDNIKKGEEWLIANPDVRVEYISRVHGMGALANEPNNNRVYNAFYGLTDTMGKRWVNLTKLELDVFLQIVLGNKPIEYFDEFVKQWNEQGGEEITIEVNEKMN